MYKKGTNKEVSEGSLNWISTLKKGILTLSKQLMFVSLQGIEFVVIPFKQRLRL